MIFPQAVFSFILGPVRTEKKNGREVLTHLQKFSRSGLMMTWPFCIHVWLFWKPQEFQVYMKADGSVDRYDFIPGTERGVYMRTPGYRWDWDLGMIWTWGYVGGHWD